MSRQTQNDILMGIVEAAGEEIARDFDAAYKGKQSAENRAVAQYIDSLLCELQNQGLLDADCNTSDSRWFDAVESAFPDDEE